MYHLFLQGHIFSIEIKNEKRKQFFFFKSGDLNIFEKRIEKKKWKIEKKPALKECPNRKTTLHPFPRLEKDKHQSQQTKRASPNELHFEQLKERLEDFHISFEKGESREHHLLNFHVLVLVPILWMSLVSCDKSMIFHRLSDLSLSKFGLVFLACNRVQYIFDWLKL